MASAMDPEEMLPCVGQAAVGIEIRAGDERIRAVCERLNHFNTHQCVLAERSFLRAMGGGCQSPVGGYAVVLGHQIHLRAVSFADGAPRRAEGRAAVKDAEALGREVAAQLKPLPR
jgi:hydroxymethylbilane synthase